MTSNSNENSIMDDANSPEINTQIMGTVSSDFVKVSDSLKEASFQIRRRGISDFPIFVLSRTDANIGSKLYETNIFKTVFNYNASLIDEFISREIIGPESIELFKEHYKDPEEYCCLFVLEKEFAGFIYLPYPED